MCNENTIQVEPTPPSAAIRSMQQTGPMPVTELDVIVHTCAGLADAVLHYPSGAGHWPAVLIWPDIAGLRPTFRAMAREVASHGYVVLTPNIYFRERPAPVVAADFSFANAAHREAVFALRATLSEQTVEMDSRDYLNFLDAQVMTDRSRCAGVHGYCMGGAFAIRTAAAVPDRIGAVASFHGAEIVTHSPTSPHLLVHATQASYLILIAANDHAQDPAAKSVLVDTLAQAAIDGTIDVCDANHGWCVPDSASFDAFQAAKAWLRLIELYRSKLV